MNTLSRLTSAYSTHVNRLATSETTSELSYYPAIRELIDGIVNELGLRFDTRTSTTERRQRGGVDLPDLALYDGDGDFVVVCGEVKLPEADLAEMARSTAQNDQVGRYLSRTRVVLLCNVRCFGLVVADNAWTGDGPVPVASRRIESTVDLWPSTAALRRGDAPASGAGTRLAELLETALTRFAPIAGPESLARILALQARRAKADLPDQFGQAVQRLADDFGSALGMSFEGVEGEEFFRSSLVQTVFYGVFAGWLLYAREWRATPFRWQELNEYLRVPFLGGLFHEIENPTRLRELGLRRHLDLATETLARVHRESFFARLRSSHGTTGRDEEGFSSAIVYFYEPFLESFDPELRKELGVWYTPPEIVRYQVRRIDQLLRTELDCARGFADERVVVLDPCCGTGAYLIEVLGCIAETLRTEGVEAELGATLLRAVRERVLGFEILTAPFVVAHLQIYLLLAELGAHAGPTDRAGVFLTNSLTGWTRAPQLDLAFPELNEERELAQRVKTDARIIVMLGNPPYNRFVGTPIEEEQTLVDPYKGIHRDDRGRQVGQTELFSQWGVRKHLLDDLYIRFFRLAEERIGQRAEFGIMSYISNSSFLAGRSHPLMREALLSGFDDVWVDDLHGNRIASERTPWGDSCETVFNTGPSGPGIKVGTAITTWLKRGSHIPDAGTCRVHRRDFWGRAEKKRSALLESLDLDGWDQERRDAAANVSEGPRAYESFVTTAAQRWRMVSNVIVGGYEDWPGLDELFIVSSQGVNPNRGIEGSLVDTSRSALEVRMRAYFSDAPDATVASRYPELMKARARYEPTEMRALLRRESTYRDEALAEYLLFPLDSRFIYYETQAKLLNERRADLGDVIDHNEILIGVPQARRPSEALPLLSTRLFDLHLHDRGSVGFPAERLVGVESALHGPDGPERRRVPNLALAVAERLEPCLIATPPYGSRALFRVIMALLYAPQYVEDHRDALAVDWARVPIPKDPTLFGALVEAGDRIVRLLDPWTDARSIVREFLHNDSGSLARLHRVGGGVVSEDDLRVTVAHFGAARGGWKPRAHADGEPWHDVWGETTGDLYLSADVFLAHVPEAVWRFELGGYPVLKKWIGYREARRRGGSPLSLTEKDHLRSMVHRIAALLVFRPRLDESYAQASADAWTVESLGIA